MNTSPLDRSLLILKHSAEMEPFRQWLLGKQIEMGERLISQNDPEQLRITQGAARFIREVSVLIDGVDAAVEKRTGR